LAIAHAENLDGRKPVFLTAGGWLRIFSAAAGLAAAAVLAPLCSVARADSGQCTLSSVSQPFLASADLAYYALVPGGDFENATWSFSGGAQRVAGSEPYAVTGKLGNWSLSLPGGSSAQSPPVCVAATEPTIRFFIAGSGTAEVKFIYGGTVIPSGQVVAAGSWMPTPVVLTGSAITAATDGNAEVSIELVGLSGDPQVDDVFIDPWNRG
jgi:hypothetical protein